MQGGDLHGRRAAKGARRSTAALLDAIFPDDLAERSALGARAAEIDVQNVLADAVRRLVSRTAAHSACAWMPREAGGLLAAAGYQRDGQPPAPDPEAFGPLCSLTRATDLGERGLDPALGRLSLLSGLTAAVAVRPNLGNERSATLAVLLLGGPDDRRGEVRPRTLAALDEIGSGLCGPLTTAGAVARLDRLDDAVRRLDRMAALGDLTTEIVHEVRNPLVSIKTFLQLLPDRLEDPEFHGDFREVVNGEVARLERLIDTVLRHAGPRAEQDPGEAADVAEALEAVGQLLAHRARERGVVIAQQIGTGGCGVAMPHDALRQVLLNLILNALEATPAGGRVTLSADSRANSEGRVVELTVDDQGSGIPDEHRERVFEAFYSTRNGQPGGLGLAISRRLVEEAGGTIDIGDAPQGGARFHVRLPGRPLQR